MLFIFVYMAVSIEIHYSDYSYRVDVWRADLYRTTKRRSTEKHNEHSAQNNFIFIIITIIIFLLEIIA